MTYSLERLRDQRRDTLSLRLSAALWAVGSFCGWGLVVLVLSKAVGV